VKKYLDFISILNKKMRASKRKTPNPGGGGQTGGKKGRQKGPDWVIRRTIRGRNVSNSENKGALSEETTVREKEGTVRGKKGTLGARSRGGPGVRGNHGKMGEDGRGHSETKKKHAKKDERRRVVLETDTTSMIGTWKSA